MSRMDGSPKQHLYLCPIGWIKTDLPISTTDYEQLWATTSDCGSFSLQNRCNNVLVKDQRALCMTTNADRKQSVLPWCRIPNNLLWAERRPVFDITGLGCAANHKSVAPAAACLSLHSDPASLYSAPSSGLQAAPSSSGSAARVAATGR